jgi:hypothetical protein
MQDANGEEKCASHKESPKGMAKAIKNVCKPSKETHPTNKICHLISSCKQSDY